MFSYREYLKRGYLGAVGRLPDDWIILNSAAQYEKLYLTEDDLAEIQAAIYAKNAKLEAEAKAAEEAERLAEEEVII